MPPEQFRDPYLDVSGERIGFYPREFYPLDNFASFQVEYAGEVWPTSEHLYQAAHFFDVDPDLVDRIRNAKSAHDAYSIAKVNADLVPEAWDEMKVDVMYEICRMKLEQHVYIQRKLFQTGELEIIEDSTKDSFWGWGDNRDGRNELGKIWMRLRDELIAGELGC